MTEFFDIDVIPSPKRPSGRPCAQRTDELARRVASGGKLFATRLTGDEEQKKQQYFQWRSSAKTVGGVRASRSGDLMCFEVIGRRSE